MSLHKNPQWWTPNHDSAWDRVKAAFQRDWDQTKHDAGSKQPDTRQSVADTVRQASGTEPIPPRGQPTFEQFEPAYRFGYGARAHYGKAHPVWNGELESELRRDWIANWGRNSWDANARHIRSGWDYENA